MKKNVIKVLSILTILVAILGCNNKRTLSAEITLEILAATSLTDALQEIGDIYTKETGVALAFNFDSSGTLKTQIENGVPADIFISAAMTQMDGLEILGLIEEGSIVPLLENTVVLIKPKGSDLQITSFTEVTNEAVEVIAIGNSDVPVGQYTETIYRNLQLWEAVQQKATLGTNVRQVLDWVATNNADCGIVYATDAAIEKQVEIICVASEDICERVLYPAGIIKTSTRIQESSQFLNFLQTQEAMQIFEKYGFQMYQES